MISPEQLACVHPCPPLVAWTPTKGPAQLTLASLQASFATNTFAPILLLKHLLPLLRKQPSTFAALSARVGSIGDNRLGGWYS
ncbi:Short-chain dehydrogenase/reductase SDR, partial [Pseudomonas amygdali pv. mellea]